MIFYLCVGEPCMIWSFWAYFGMFNTICVLSVATYHACFLFFALFATCWHWYRYCLWRNYLIVWIDASGDRWFPKWIPLARVARWPLARVAGGQWPEGASGEEGDKEINGWRQQSVEKKRECRKCPGTEMEKCQLPSSHPHLIGDRLFQLIFSNTFFYS